MRAIRFRAFILLPLFVPPTGRYAAGVARVPLFPGRRVSEWSAMKRDGVLPAEGLADAGRAIPSALIRQILKSADPSRTGA